MNTFPTFLDFEASGLHPESYPIQVGWTTSSGSAESIYIRPVESWTYWSLEAEDIHGLTPRLLTDVGRPPGEVAERMNAALAGQTVYCDGLPWDRHWLDRLFEAAGVKPAFTLGDAWELFRQHVPVRPSLEDAFLGGDQNLRVLRDAILEEIRAEAALRVPERGHQADIDARRLAAMWAIIQERRARMGAETYGDLSHFAG